MKRFELVTIETDDPVKNKEIAMKLRHTQETEGWQVILSLAKSNIALMEQMIIERKDPEGQELKEETVDVFREARQFMIDFIDLPEKIIGVLEPTNTIESDVNYDPYAKTKEEMTEKKPIEN